MMKDAVFFRKGNVIRGPAGDEVFKSVNKAKKKSRKIQMSLDGRMGLGTLRVVEKLPELAESAAIAA